MPTWEQFEHFTQTFGVPILILAAIGFALWRLGKQIVRKFLGDETHPGLVDRWYEDERKRWDLMTDQVAKQQSLCQAHVTASSEVRNTMDRHHESWQRVAITLCKGCREVVEREKPACGDILLRHCSEIERIIEED